MPLAQLSTFIFFKHMKQFTLLFIISLAFFACESTQKEKPQGGDLSKNTWKLVEYDFGGTTYLEEGQRPITARFEKGTINGTAACNRYFGNYEAKGIGLRFNEVATTKRICADDLMNLEARFLNLIENARNYTATLNKLTIFCTDGELRFEASHEAAIQKNSYADFLTAFEPLSLDDPHFYSVLNEKDADKYAFKGKKMNPYLLDYIDPETAKHYKTTQANVYQIGKYKDHYILRTPGKYASTDLTIFSLDKYHNRVKKEALLTYAWCDEGACNQQDAWLKDINGDGKFDIVTKYVFTENGKVQSTTMTALIQQGPNGTFVEDKSIKLKAKNYVMAELK